MAMSLVWVALTQRSFPNYCSASMVALWCLLGTVSVFSSFFEFGVCIADLVWCTAKRKTKKHMTLESLGDGLTDHHLLLLYLLTLYYSNYLFPAPTSGYIFPLLRKFLCLLNVWYWLQRCKLSHVTIVVDLTRPQKVLLFVCFSVSVIMTITFGVPFLGSIFIFWLYGLIASMILSLRT